MLYETIRQDNLSHLLSTRYETFDRCLVPEDTPIMLQDNPTPIMVAAFYGSTHCFAFLTKKSNIYDVDVYFFLLEFAFYFQCYFLVFDIYSFYLGIAFILQLLVGTHQFLDTFSRT